MTALALLSIVPAVGIVLLGCIITRDTWIGGRKWPEPVNVNRAVARKLIARMEGKQ